MAFSIQSFIAQGAQMFLVLAIAPAVTGVVRKVKARLRAGAGRRCFSLTATC